MAKQRRWTDVDRERGLDAVARLGGYQLAANETGIPKEALQDWEQTDAAPSDEGAKFVGLLGWDSGRDWVECSCCGSLYRREWIEEGFHCGQCGHPFTMEPCVMYGVA